MSPKQESNITDESIGYPQLRNSAIVLPFDGKLFSNIHVYSELLCYVLFSLEKNGLTYMHDYSRLSPCIHMAFKESFYLTWQDGNWQASSLSGGNKDSHVYYYIDWCDGVVGSIVSTGSPPY